MTVGDGKSKFTRAGRKHTSPPGRVARGQPGHHDNPLYFRALSLRSALSWVTDFDTLAPGGVNILPGMNAGASTYAVPSPIKGSGTAWVLLGSWALSPARPTPIHPRH